MGVTRPFDVLYYVLPGGRLVVYLGIHLITPALDAKKYVPDTFGCID